MQGRSIELWHYSNTSKAQIVQAHPIMQRTINSQVQIEIIVSYILASALPPRVSPIPV